MGAAWNAFERWARYGREWTLAEDKELRRLHREARRLLYDGKIRSLYVWVGNQINRSPMSVSARMAVLKAADRLNNTRRK